MTARRARSSGWPVKAVNAPSLTNAEWAVTAVPALILLLMAITQLISFSDFTDLLESMGFAGPTAWAVGIIVAELWGAAGFFKWRLSMAFRNVSNVMAVLAAGFWFVNNLQLVASGAATKLENSGFFGKYVAQQPSWWTVIEVSILLFWVVSSVKYLRDNQPASSRN
jgi:hypothetical protein